MTAISDYFRTALLIDDRMAADYGPLEALDDVQAEGGEQEPAEGLVEPSEADATPVHPADLVRAFFASGVACSVLEPVSGSSDLVQQALRGAQIADLLILDWLLYGSDEVTIEMIDAVASERAGRLTVIVVFTGMPGLGDVAQRLVDDAQFDAVNDYALQRGNTVVLVFGKPGARLTDGEDWRQPASYGDLPRMIRDDLEFLFKGFMPEFAFSGINALRESAPRILATFNEELDAGALIHRALLSDPDEAATQFIRLLCSDMELVLRDAEVSNVWDIDASSEALARLTVAGDSSPLVESLRRSPKVADDLKNLSDDKLTREAISRGLAGIGLGDSKITEASTDLVKAMSDASRSNENLAVLIDSSGFGKASPRLELGVIVRDEQEGYWLCVQPLCDSVRLTENRAFPMMGICTHPQKPVAMIRSPEGDALPVAFDRRPYMLRLVEFSQSGGVVSAEGEAPAWRFTDVNERTYLAVARLRPEFAAQAVQELTSTVARVGADTSELLRRGGLS